MNDQLIIGDWRFDIASATLTQPGCTKRLEDRSARTLAFLGRRRGEVVSKTEILAEVWQGRTVSNNSVAIVIADLRRALGESSRASYHIETIGKRGYRLRAVPDVPAEPSPPIERTRDRRVIRMGNAIAAVAALLIVILIRAAQPTPVVALMLGPVRNDTGEGRYEPLARSLAALVEERAARMPGVIATDTKLAHTRGDGSWKCGPA